MPVRPADQYAGFVYKKREDYDGIPIILQITPGKIR